MSPSRDQFGSLSWPPAGVSRVYHPNMRFLEMLLKWLSPARCPYSGKPMCVGCAWESVFAFTGVGVVGVALAVLFAPQVWWLVVRFWQFH